MPNPLDTVGASISHFQPQDGPTGGCEVRRVSRTSVPTRIDGIDIPAAAFADRLAFIEAVNAGLSGEVIRQAVEVVGHRDLFVRLLGTTSGCLSRMYRQESLGRCPSEAVLDALRVVAGAIAVFGTLGKADEWLDTEIAALGGQRPIDLCDTFEGRGLVRDAIRKIEHGDFP